MGTSARHGSCPWLGSLGMGALVRMLRAHSSKKIATPVRIHLAVPPLQGTGTSITKPPCTLR
eukprot:NODE_2765_length_544_cov_129.917172_g2381_i0.p3 GENE.NODE_2765_length_544_cov_129.917172_g2381_i0~~NODE_2765_length_544_cov_129.917172_g2381_i0.p3  ORF type:complete len:62 (+),score=13.18 NODE_2765_length_544_cov_129.917172_g2381_i0:349-534(+)